MFILIKLNNIINLVGLSELIYFFILCNPSGPCYKYYFAGLESTMALPRPVTLFFHGKVTLSNCVVLLNAIDIRYCELLVCFVPLRIDTGCK